MTACSSGEEPPVGKAGGEQQRWLSNVEQPFPSALSALGVFADVDALTTYPDVTEYTPRYPLYSNGLAKQRTLYLPPDTAIEVGDQRWQFPTGSVFTKTFSWHGAPVETRVLVRRSSGWDYGLYRWAGADAEYAGDNWIAETVELDGVTHTLPARLDCRTCHEAGLAASGHPVLGLDAYQLDPQLPGELFAAPPESRELDAPNTEAAAAYGYFLGNCVSCHNGASGPNNVFSLMPQDVLANTIDHPTQSETGVGVRVVPGEPAASVLYESVVMAPRGDYAGEFKAMPPLGVNVVDPAAARLLAAWIESLPDALDLPEEPDPARDHAAD